MSERPVLLERRGDVGIVTLNRPERRNAINDTLAVELERSVVELDADESVCGIVLTGAGTAFCAGADIGRFERAVDETGDATPPTRHDWVALVRGVKPIVCAVNGPCIGAGLTRTLPCDARIASRAATFSMRFVRVGLVPEIGSTQILPQLVGLQHAADLCLSGRTITADDAEAIGLVLTVVEPERLLDGAVELAREYGRNPAGAVREAKRLLYANACAEDVSLVRVREGEAMARRWSSPETKAAIAALRGN